MKIEQLLVQHLYNTKQVKLQGIGIFKINTDAVYAAEGDKDSTTFSFDYNLKTTEDELLVNYIVQETNKIKPLASSDLESYVILVQQFLNLGKPFYIDGIGTIQKNQLGHFEFFSGNYTAQKIGDLNKQSKEKKDDQIPSLESEDVPNNKGRNLMIGLTTLGIVLVGFTLYYFINVKNNSSFEEPNANSAIKIVSDSLKTPHLDSASNINTDTNNKLVSTKPNISNNNSFSIVLKEYPTSKAVEMAYAKLTEYGHKVKIIKVDSLKYKLIMTFIRPLKDTLKVKDSLKIFFGGKPYLERL